MPGAPCPLPASAKNDSDDGGEPTALLKVSEPELRMKVTGLRKPVSPASSVMLAAAPERFSMFELESCSSLTAPMVDCASVT